MRVTAAERLAAVVGGPRGPLEIVLAIAVDQSQDTQTRLGACSIALPFLYLRLSATQIDAKHTVTHVDANAVLVKLNDRIERLGKSEPPALIEVKAEVEEDGAGE